MFLSHVFFEGTLQTWISECLTNDETTLDGPPIGHRSVSGYNQSGHIPNANPNDPEVILWSGKQRSNAGRNGTLWSASGFGPGTFGYGKLARFTVKLAHSNGLWSPRRDLNLGP